GGAGEDGEAVDGAGVVALVEDVLEVQFRPQGVVAEVHPRVPAHEAGQAEGVAQVAGPVANIHQPHRHADGSAIMPSYGVIGRPGCYVPVGAVSLPSGARVINHEPRVTGAYERAPSTERRKGLLWSPAADSLLTPEKLGAIDLPPLAAGRVRALTFE